MLVHFISNALAVCSKRIKTPDKRWQIKIPFSLFFVFLSPLEMCTGEENFPAHRHPAASLLEIIDGSFLPSDVSAFRPGFLFKGKTDLLSTEAWRDHSPVKSKIAPAHFTAVNAS